ncbi:hypothetical protein NAMH_1359 [Nautilia profundicola AmH]|uniref:Uncharacterized protein n=1 Tax=Nautilia profundicola (strain ATCC BAA-1463 / DSM 18972 / AmH) TaxID=598659 RepID=B9L5W3_NAUPA|nr:hypothetical protein NAMH_1359 [Nautilia profundicola AmH]
MQIEKYKYFYANSYLFYVEFYHKLGIVADERALRRLNPSSTHHYK